ncbi:MAG TPA: tRNA pseudouridine(55) synthase TruB [Dissulfurispiraceae bacterium]|nr:tRNA pseudouridine(55) synthase TruB [Dissulfurispiraceae bacterium]
MNLVICLDKEQGMTSQVAVTSAKRFFGARKAGHAGTLDPLATGVLLVCLNEATKVTGLFSELTKEYLATMKLGAVTDTYDAEGDVVARKSIDDIACKDVESALAGFRGEIRQVPPMYSAIKHRGLPLYKYARRGLDVPREPRAVEIEELEMVRCELPDVQLRVVCSKGTYIRSLCHDIGLELGVGAHMTKLVRTRIGQFTLEHCARLSDLAVRSDVRVPLAEALRHIPAVFAAGRSLERLRHGNSVPGSSQEVKGNWSGHGMLRLCDDQGGLFGIGRVTDGTIRAERLFVCTETIPGGVS